MADRAAMNDLKTDLEDERFLRVPKSADNIGGFLTWRLEENKLNSRNYTHNRHKHGSFIFLSDPPSNIRKKTS